MNCCVLRLFLTPVGFMKKNIHWEERKFARGYSADDVGKPETRNRFPAPCSLINLFTFINKQPMFWIKVRIRDLDPDPVTIKLQKT
jgi:hypothetical protein